MAETAQFQTRYQRDDSTNGTGPPHVIRDEMRGFNRNLAFIFDPDPTGTGKFQVTFEIDLALIKNNPGAVDWNDWGLGVNGDHQEDITTTNITGWRLIADSGDVKGQVRGGF